MKTHGMRNWFFICLLLVFAFAQFVACSSSSSSSASAPAITSDNYTVFTEGSAETFTVTATGNPTPAFAITGSLPSGVTFDDTTGVLSGTPTTSGTYPLTITASNGISPNATQSFTLAVVTTSTDALIVHDGTAGLEANVVTNLTNIMTAAGLTVTTSVGVPTSSLSGYAQIWDVRFNTTTPLSVDDIIRYTTYIEGGRTLVVIGENTGFAVRNDSIVFLIDYAGGGSIALISPANLQTVNSPFTGPDPITTVTYQAAAGTADPGTGTLITQDASNIGAALYYARGTLSNAPAGRLMVVFDINFLDIGADAALQSLTGNMVRLP